MSRWFYFLLIFSFLAVLLYFVHAWPLLVFIVAALGIMPLAALIGQAVEEVAEHTGELVGGLLFATFGNATELIIGILALSQGLVDVVRASIIGSILGNTLLVLGAAIIVGNIKHGRLRFETRPASMYASQLTLCVGGLLLPTVAELLASQNNQNQIIARGNTLSDFIAVMLLVGYIASIIFSIFHVRQQNGEHEEDFDPIRGARSAVAMSHLLAYRQQLAKSQVPGRTDALQQIDNALDSIVMPVIEKQPAVTTEQSAQQAVPESVKTPLWRGLLLLCVATVGVGILSEILVDAIEPVTELLHWNPAFVGLVFIPLIGGIPEYFNTISMALHKRMSMVLAASAGSSIQIALLIAPILVLVSLVMPVRLNLVFSIVELAVLALTTFLFSEITRDGEFVWLEGLLLILLYAMMGGTIFLFGGG